MGIKSVHILLTMALASGTMVSAQGTFQNLDFEEANIVPIVGSLYYPYAVTVANALPGWTVDYGNVQQTQITYNAEALGSAHVTLFANGYPGIVGPIIDGNFSVLLQAGVFNGVFTPATPASISQTGQIPSGTQSLLFDVGNFGQTLLPDVSIGNDNLSLFPVGSGQGISTSYTIYGANISAWAGQTEQVTFSSPLGNILIDDISFSPTAVTPEPDPLVLMSIGGALFAGYRRLMENRK